MKASDTLSEEQMVLLLKHKIGCTSGVGTGICSVVFAFSANPLVVLSNSSAMPGEEEIALLRSYVEFKAAGYRPSYMAKFKAPIPVAEGHCTTVFVKGPSSRWPNMNGWAYRKATWTHGPTYYPFEGMPLDKLIEEHVEQGSERWLKASKT